MTRFWKMIESLTRRSLPTLLMLFIGVPVIAQQATVSAPLTADEVIERCAIQSTGKLLQYPKLSPGMSLPIS
jgi:hypothetical protein